jgi:hypothetical protein
MVPTMVVREMTQTQPLQHCGSLRVEGRWPGRQSALGGACFLSLRAQPCLHFVVVDMRDMSCVRGRVLRTPCPCSVRCRKEPALEAGSCAVNVQVQFLVWTRELAPFQLQQVLG